jgi:hypothetical protein
MHARCGLAAAARRNDVQMAGAWTKLLMVKELEGAGSLTADDEGNR